MFPTHLSLDFYLHISTSKVTLPKQLNKQNNSPRSWILAPSFRHVMQGGNAVALRLRHIRDPGDQEPPGTPKRGLSALPASLQKAAAAIRSLLLTGLLLFHSCYHALMFTMH